jgi:hypothetical protein
VNATDTKILECLGEITDPNDPNLQFWTLDALINWLGMARSTLKYRLNSLRERGYVDCAADYENPKRYLWHRTPPPKSSWEQCDERIKAMLVEAVKDAGPEGLTEAVINDLEFRAVNFELKRMCDQFDAVGVMLRGA